MTNYSTPSNISNVPQLFQYANRTSDFLFGDLMLLTLFSVIVLYLVVNRKEGFSNSVIAAGFISSIVSSFFWFFDIVSTYSLSAYVLLFAAAIVWKMNQ